MIETEVEKVVALMFLDSEMSYVIAARVGKEQKKAMFGLCDKEQ